MKINMIGIGRMGHALVENMLDNEHEVQVFDVNQEAVDNLKETRNVKGWTNWEEFVANPIRNEKYRIFFIMLPAGNITNGVLEQLVEVAEENDVIIEGGNSNHKDSMHYGKLLEEKGAYFFDVGTSGGIEGARNGASFMIGGDKAVFDEIESLFESLASPGGYVYTGRTGSGHFLKLVHNAIYYGYQQALGEGLEILHKSDFDYDLAEVTRALQSSVIRGWILDIVHDAFVNDNELSEFSGHVQASKSTNWVIEEAMDLGVPVPAMGVALAMRQRGVQDDEAFSGKVISALRSGVGGLGKKKTK